jgi:hypothetical protein
MSSLVTMWHPRCMIQKNSYSYHKSGAQKTNLLVQICTFWLTENTARELMDRALITSKHNIVSGSSPLSSTLHTQLFDMVHPKALFFKKSNIIQSFVLHMHSYPITMFFLFIYFSILHSKGGLNMAQYKWLKAPMEIITIIKNIFLTI